MNTWWNKPYFLQLLGDLMREFFVFYIAVGWLFVILEGCFC